MNGESSTRPEQQESETPAAVDTAQLDRHLAMTPAERLRAHREAARNLGRLLKRARRVDVG